MIKRKRTMKRSKLYRQRDGVNHPTGFRNILRKAVIPVFSFFLYVSALPLPAYAAEPTYPIIPDVKTTRERTVCPLALPEDTTQLKIDEVPLYEPYHYSSWQWDNEGSDAGRLLPDGTIPPEPTPAETLLSFFTMSDIHIVDKESPAQAIYNAIKPGKGFGDVDIPAYSPIMLSTTHVLDAAVQTINALHKNPGPAQAPFDFGMSLGDDANSDQYNELRWFIDVMDGKRITPSSGAHKGAGTIDYQKPYQSAGLDKSISWYQTLGNHDQYWCGMLRYDDYARKTVTGNTVVDMGIVNGHASFDARGYYMGVIDGATKYGTIIDYGSVETMGPPVVALDPKRHALSTPASSSLNWMKEFFNTTSNPKGHGFTRANLDDDFACYSFEPKSNVPLKVIVLDDTCKENPYVSSGKHSTYARACLDQKRYDWLVNELEQGQAEGKLMIITAHIPVGPHLTQDDSKIDTLFVSTCKDGSQPVGTPCATGTNIANNDPVPPYNVVTDYTLLQKLHEYSNLLLWAAGHRHINTVTPQPAPHGKGPEFGFWEVETPSLRDFPQGFRTFKIVRNTNNTVSIFVTDVDPAVQEDPTAPHASLSPAAKSRGYAIGAHRISVGGTAAFTDTTPRVYNAELIKPLAAPYTMTVNVTGPGTVKMGPYQAATCTATTPCSASYLPGTTVTLVPAAATGAAFAGWSICEGKSTCTITMNSDADVTATFTSSPTLAVTPSYKYFGTKKVGTGTIATFTVRNTATKGVADLVIGNLSLNQTEPVQFTLTAGKDRCSGKTIQSGKSCTFQVTFRPTSVNTKMATVTIPSNDPDGPATIEITGAGK